MVDAWCKNCNWEGEVAIPKGTAIKWEEPIGNLARCENCGCTTLQRYGDPDEEPAPVEPAEEATAPQTTSVPTDEELRRTLEEFERPWRRRERRRAPLPPPQLPMPTPMVPLPVPVAPYRMPPLPSKYSE